MDTHGPEMMALQEQLAAKSADLSKLLANHVEWTDELGFVKLPSAAGATVSGDLKPLAGVRERPARRTKATRKCKDSSTTTFTVALLAL